MRGKLLLLVILLGIHSVCFTQNTSNKNDEEASGQLCRDVVEQRENLATQYNVDINSLNEYERLLVLYEMKKKEWEKLSSMANVETAIAVANTMYAGLSESFDRAFGMLKLGKAVNQGKGGIERYIFNKTSNSFDDYMKDVERYGIDSVISSINSSSAYAFYRTMTKEDVSFEQVLDETIQSWIDGLAIVKACKTLEEINDKAQAIDNAIKLADDVTVRLKKIIDKALDQEYYINEQREFLDRFIKERCQDGQWADTTGIHDKLKNEEENLLSAKKEKKLLNVAGTKWGNVEISMGYEGTHEITFYSDGKFELKDGFKPKTAPYKGEYLQHGNLIDVTYYYSSRKYSIQLVVESDRLVEKFNSSPNGRKYVGRVWVSNYLPH